jgi:hypothetical protein
MNPSAEPGLTFDRFRALTAPLLGPERLELFLLLPDEVREQAWDDLARRIDSERQARGGR